MLFRLSVQFLKYIQQLKFVVISKMNTLFLLVLCFFAAKAKIFPLEPGIHKEIVGDMKIIDNKWSMIINFNLLELNLNVEKTKRVFTDLNNYCNHMKQYGTHSCSKDILYGSDLIKRLNNDNNRINDLLSKKRTKRGLFNIIGSGFKFFFGTMDASDAKKIESKLVEFTENNSETDHLLHDQIQIVDQTFRMANDTLNHVLYNEEIIKQNTKDISYLFQTMKNKNSLEKEIIFQKLNTMFNVMYDVTNNDLQNFERFLIDIHSNILNTKIISFSKLIDEIKKIENKLPKDMDLILNLENPDIEVFFKFLKLGYIYNDKNMFVIIQIPLISRENYKIMNLYPIPKCKNNTCVALEITSDIFALSDSNNYHVKMEKQFFEKNCLQMKKIFFCDEINIIYKQIERNCETAILFQNNKNIKSFCKEKAFHINDNLVIKLYNENSFLIINSYEEKATLKCKGSQNINIILKNTLKIVINKECKLYLKTMILKFNHDNEHIETNLNLFEKVDFEITNETIKIMENLNKTEIIPHVLNINEYKNLGKNINLLKEEIETKMHKKDLINVKSKNFIINIILFTTLIIIIIAVMISCYKNRIKRMLNIIRDAVVIEMADQMERQPKENQSKDNQQNTQPNKITTVSRFRK